MRSFSFIIVLCLGVHSYAQTNSIIPDLNSKIEGMMFGTLIGDAAGGPNEFSKDYKRAKICKSKKKITGDQIAELAAMFTLGDYPDTANPYGAWLDTARAGTVTDDSRLKMIMIRTLNKYGNKFDKTGLALNIGMFRNDMPKAEYLPLYDEWIKEYQGAANWVLGNKAGGIPPERMFGGKMTINGQLMFTPIACLNPNDPLWCYKKTFENNFLDNGYAKDFSAAIVAGLAAALQQGSDWDSITSCMLRTDPYDYKNADFAGREVEKWMKKAEEIGSEADGRISVLFNLLDEKLESTYGWEPWVPIVVTLSCAETVRYNPMATMQLILEYGHDTDSNLQLAGAIIGALYGKDIWPQQMRDLITLRLASDYDQDFEGWVKVLKMHRVKGREE